jgi:GDPmannose 4,6-dehydratase
MAELLLSKGYQVIGTRRRSSTNNLGRIEHLLSSANLRLEHADMTDRSSLRSVIRKYQPDEIYNLAAQSDVAVSFVMPQYTRHTIMEGTINLLTVCDDELAGKKFKIYLAGSSEMFGRTPPPQNEQSEFDPVSPYAQAKEDAYIIGESFKKDGMWIAQGILFNHESSRRGENFVTRKITRALGRMACGLQQECFLGNLHAKRDWGHASDYMEAAWLMLQQEEPQNFVIATGESHSVEEFLDVACEKMHHISNGVDYRGLFKIDPLLYRPVDVPELCGDSSKARRILGWKPILSFRDLVNVMVRGDLELAKREAG